MLKILAAALLISILCVIVAQYLRSRDFEGMIAGLERKLIEAQREEGQRSSVPASIEAFALRNGARSGGPKTVTISQAAEMRLAIDQEFFALDASQISATRMPGFVWQATGRMYSIVPIRVVDSYVGGDGLLEVRLAGTLAVAKAAGEETAKGEAMRFLAELPWNPDAILNASGLNWQVIDDQTVSVAMDTAGGSAQVILRLDADGDIVAIEAQDRPRSGATPAPWVGRFSQYEFLGPYRFPRYGEVAWVLPEGEFVYWRGTILSIEPNE